jgi:hypothetical protein
VCSFREFDDMPFCVSVELLEHWEEHPPACESLEGILNAWTERKPASGRYGEMGDYAPSQQPQSSMTAEQIAANMRAMGAGMGLTAVRPESALPPAVREAIEKYERERAAQNPVD